MSALSSTALVLDGDGDLVVLGTAESIVNLSFQSLPGTDWTGWGALAAAPADLDHGVSVASAPDGSLVAVAVDSGGSLHAIETTSSQWPAAWTCVGRPATTSLSGGCGVTITKDEHAVVVAAGEDGALWSLTRPPRGSWNDAAWVSGGMPSPSAPVNSGGDVCCAANGALLAVAVGADGQLYALPGTLEGWEESWTPVGCPESTTLTGPVGVTRTGGASAAVAVIGSDGNAYTANPADSGSQAFQPLGSPPVQLLTNATGSIGVCLDASGQLDVVAAGTDGNAYAASSATTGPGAWTSLDRPGVALPLRAVLGTGKADYVACVIAPASGGQSRAKTRTFAPAGLLRPGEVVTEATTSVRVPSGAPFVLAAVQDATGELVSGVGMTITQPDGTPLDVATDPAAQGVVVGMDGGLVTYVLMQDPPSGDWSVTIDPGSTGDEGFHVTFTTLPSLNVQATIAATLQQMCRDDAMAALPGASWGCMACRFGVSIGAAGISAAIAAGVTALGPESVVVLWLAEFAGMTGDDVLAFIIQQADDGLTAVSELVDSICAWTGACS